MELIDLIYALTFVFWLIAVGLAISITYRVVVIIKNRLR